MKPIDDFYAAKIINSTGDGEDKIIVAALPETFAFDIASQYEAPFAQGFGGDNRISSLLRLGGLALTNQAMTAQVWQGTSDIQFTLPFVFQADTNELTDVVKPLKALLKLALPSTLNDGGLLQSPGPRLNYKKLFGKEFEPAMTAFSGSLVNAATVTTQAAGNTALAALFGKEDGGLKNAAGAAREAYDNVDAASGAFSNAIKNSIDNNIRLEIGRFLHFPHVVILDVQQTANIQPIVGTGVFQRVEVQVTFKTFMLPTANDLDQMFQQRI